MSKKRQAEGTDCGRMDSDSVPPVQRPRFQPRTPAPLPTRPENPVLAPAGPPGIRPCPFLELPTSRDRGDWARAMGARTPPTQAPAAAGRRRQRLWHTTTPPTQAPQAPQAPSDVPARTPPTQAPQAPQAPAAAGRGSAAPAAVYLAPSDVPEWITAAAKRLVERHVLIHRSHDKAWD